MIEGLIFMAGNWTAPFHGGIFEESWSFPEAGTMVGHGRLVIEGKTQFMEFLSIEMDEVGDCTMYIVLGALSKGAKVPIAFKLASMEATSATFERGGDDFPVSISYERSGERLPCTLSGVDGKTELYDFGSA